MKFEHCCNIYVDFYVNLFDDIELLLLDFLRDRTEGDSSIIYTRLTFKRGSYICLLRSLDTSYAIIYTCDERYSNIFLNIFFLLIIIFTYM